MSEAVALAMDMGGTWTRAALISQGGEILWSDRTPTNANRGKDAIISSAENLLQQGLSQAGNRDLAGIGIAVAGPVDRETGTLYDPPNLAPLDGVSFKTLWEGSIGHPIHIGNDATLAALGEYRYGAGQGAHTLVYMTISTGIGGGVVVEGRPLTGAYGMAGELGHMFIERDTPICACGKSGCLEAIASGTAIARRARSLIEEGGNSALKEMVSGDMPKITAAMVFDAAKQGDLLASQVVDDAADALGLGLVNVLHIFNPDVIVVGGGVSQNWDYLKPIVETRIEAQAMSHVLKRGFKLVVSSLGDDIGLYGAAAAVFQR